MQIFVSWSGQPAQALADFLQIWLQRVIQELDPFMSTNSIAKGARWSPEIAKRLEATSEAIICVTSENQDAPWLNFEAGALAKATGSRVRPLLLDLSPSDVTGPLSEFQLTSATDKEDVRRLLNSINENCDRPLTNDILTSTFEREWSALEEKVNDVVKLVGKQDHAKQRKRDDPELLDEVLSRVRAVERLTNDHFYMSEQMFREIVGRPTHRLISPDLRWKMTAASNTIEKIYLFLRENAQRPVRIDVGNGKAVHGEIVGFEGEMPDVTVLLGHEGTTTEIPIASIGSVQFITADKNPA